VTSVPLEPMTVTSIGDHPDSYPPSTNNLIDDTTSSSNKSLDFDVTALLPKVPPMPSPMKGILSSSEVLLREESLGTTTLSSIEGDILSALFPVDDPTNGDILPPVDEDFLIGNVEEEDDEDEEEEEEEEEDPMMMATEESVTADYEVDEDDLVHIPMTVPSQAPSEATYST